jgi:hypothetical protein
VAAFAGRAQEVNYPWCIMGDTSSECVFCLFDPVSNVCGTEGTGGLAASA